MAMARADERITRTPRTTQGALSPGILVGLILLGYALGIGVSEVSAAYRLTFQNGTSVEVQGYEDLGEAIRYPRYGGTVTVPKGQVTAIQEVAPNPALVIPPMPAPRVAPSPVPTDRPGPPAPAVSAPRVPVPSVPQPGPARVNPAQPGGSFGFLSGAVRTIGEVVVFLLALAVVFVLVRALAKVRRTEADLPYRTAGPLLTPAERSFYGVLCQAVETRYTVFAKVRLGDVLAVPHGTPRFWTHRNRIDRKHVDFLLCAPHDLTPLLAVELDDASHDRRDRRDRDAFADKALAVADLPILRVPAQRGYAPGELRGLIEERLTGRTTPRGDDEVRL